MTINGSKADETIFIVQLRFCKIWWPRVRAIMWDEGRTSNPAEYGDPRRQAAGARPQNQETKRCKVLVLQAQNVSSLEYKEN